MTNAARVFPELPEDEPKPRKRKHTWIWVLGWTACFLALPGFLVGLLHQQRSREVAAAMPRVSASRTPIVPGWIPLRADFRVEQSHIGQSSGNATLFSEDPVDRMVLYFQKGFMDSGFAVSTNLMNQDDSITMAILNISHAEKGQFALVTLSKAPSGSRIEIAFSERK